MKLKSIQLTNYRNFKEFAIDFGVETTVFIGKNGTGKTNLITAIAQSLSFIFSKRKDEMQFDFIASSDASVKVESFSPTDASYVYNDEKNGYYAYPLSIKAESSEELQWEFRKENESSGLKDTLYRDANIRFWEQYTDRTTIKELPIFAFFHDSYPHKTANTGKNMQDKLNSGNPMPRNTGYYMWNDEKNCTDIWVQYFTMQWTNVLFQNGKGNENYVKAITRTIINFSTKISELVYSEVIKIEDLIVEKRGKEDILIVMFSNGIRTPFIQLPQGYKRIFSIVFDIANRSFFLNSHCNPLGIVVIDEIELHLHPSIAQEILNGLKQTFPMIQFIVSTHSPLVITNFKQEDKKNIVYKLFNNEGEYQRVEDLYGVDYNSGLKDWMDTTYRKSAIDNLKESYCYWESVGNNDMLNRVKKEIKEMVGEDSRFYQSLK